MIRIAVAGANGRMGHKLIKAIKQSEKLVLSAALTRPNSKLCGIDVGELVGIGTTGVLINDNLMLIKENFDILIDFTEPEATLNHLNFCKRYKKGIIIGTTGFNANQKINIRAAAKYIGIVFAENFSTGINILFKLLEKLVKVIDDSIDIEIIETHHRHKKDAPSGTALAIGEYIANALGRNLQDCAVYNKIKCNKRKVENIGFSIIRAGDIIGKHTVLLANIDEYLKITHSVSNRMTFAKGAVRAAIWLDEKKKNGLFNMIDVLNLNEF